MNPATQSFDERGFSRSTDYTSIQNQALHALLLDEANAGLHPASPNCQTTSQRSMPGNA
jgi:hypothetical protein